jgi:hypothetical protein
MTQRHDLLSTLRMYLADRRCSWSIGGNGAIGEFHWRPDDADADLSAEELRISTAAGGVRLAMRDDAVPYAFQNLSRHPERWLQGVSLCLPWRRAAGAARTVLHQIGPDGDAMRPADRDAVLFDMGLGLPHVDVCVRTDSEELLRVLCEFSGRSLLEPGNAAMGAIKEASPHRIFMSRLGRIEVYQRIGSPRMDPPTPVGPHTHLLPRLLRSRRVNAEANDAPPYHRACVYLYPSNPLVDSLGNRKPYDHEAQARFASLLERWGDSAFVAEKKRAADAIAAGVAAREFDASTDPRLRHAMRITIREQAHLSDETSTVGQWRKRFDRVRPPTHPLLAH